MSLGIVLMLLSGLVAWAGTALVRRYAVSLGLVQLPNHRSSHTLPTPSGGGQGIAAGGLLSGLALGAFSGVDDSAWWVGLALSLLIAAVGLLDDICGVAARWRLLVQLIAVGGLFAALGPLPAFVLGAGATVSGGWLLLLLGAAAVWWVNLFNFMDGIDGLAASEAIFLLLGSVVLIVWSVPSAAPHPMLWWMLGVAAATAGFLGLNWPPARIFMGDVGSTYLAFMLALFALASVRAQWLSYTVWVILAGVFVTDATVTLLARLLRGERVYEAHRTHAYQWLARRWGGHRPVLLLYWGINVLWLLPLAGCALTWPAAGGWFAGGAYAPLVLALVVVNSGSETDA